MLGLLSWLQPLNADTVLYSWTLNFLRNQSMAGGHMRLLVEGCYVLGRISFGDCCCDCMHVRKVGGLAGLDNSMEFLISGEHKRAITFQEICCFHKVLPNMDSDGELELQVD